MVDDGVVLVCLKRRRNRQVRRGVSVENVDKFRFLYCRNHDTSTLGVSGEILPRNDTTRSRFAKSLLVDLDEAAGLWVIVENDNPARIGAYYRVV